MKTQDDEDELQADLIDRFGDYPQEVTNLLAVAHLKRLADQALVDRIQRTDNHVLVTLSPKATTKVNGEKLFQVLNHTTLRATVTPEDARMIVNFDLQKLDQATWLDEVTQFVDALAQAVNPVKQEPLHAE